MDIPTKCDKNMSALVKLYLISESELWWPENDCCLELGEFLIWWSQTEDILLCTSFFSLKGSPHLRPRSFCVQGKTKAPQPWGMHWINFYSSTCGELWLHRCGIHNGIYCMRAWTSYLFRHLKSHKLCYPILCFSSTKEQKFVISQSTTK